MKSYLVSIVFFLLIACKKEPSYETRIVLFNSCDSTIHVELYPKSEYLHLNLYKNSSIGSGYTEKSYNLFQSNYQYLYYSDYFTISPQTLIYQVFDSIVLNVKLDTIVTVKFSPQSVQHYSQNIYNSSSIWVSRNFDENTPMNGSSQLIHVRQFDFKVVKDSIKIK